VYLFQGSDVVLDKTILSEGKGAILPARSIELAGGAGNSRLLMLTGKPIEEPVAKYGPFVMNTQEEIEQAFEDFRLTRFGGWPWRHPDPVHDADRGRFAIFPDGREIKM
jgi:redox-sensitive bicupin YhaK (pirin superfamily)